MKKAIYEVPMISLKRFEKEDVVVMSGSSTSLNTYGNAKSAGKISIMSLIEGMLE